MTKLVHIVRRGSAPCFWILAIVVLFLSLGPAPREEPLTGWDKGNHVLAFLALSCTALVAWPRTPMRVCSALLAYGCAIEVVQSFVGRDAALADVAADVVGIAIGWAVLRVPALRRLLALDEPGR